jgi:hypothetical protein
MKLRWLIFSNPVTADQVRAERERTGESPMLIKQRLADATAKVLQFSTDDGNTWTNVPTIVLPYG